MEADINLSFTLPVGLAEQVLAFVKSLSSSQDEPSLLVEASGNARADAPPQGTAFRFEPVPLVRQELRHLLDERLTRIVRFIIEKGGKFYNDELATELGVDDPQTSIFLGHLTRKLRKTGVSAEGFRGTNWYSKIRSSGRTLISVRSDVLVTLSKALEK